VTSILASTGIPQASGRLKKYETVSFSRLKNFILFYSFQLYCAFGLYNLFEDYITLNYNKNNQAMLNLKFLYPIHKKYFWKFLFSKNAFLVNIKNHKFFVRPRTTDLYILTEVFGEKCYQPTFKFKNEKIKTIVDLGAHIGAFSVWAAQKFSPKKIVSVEMEKNNLEMLRRNVSANSFSNKIKIVSKAIYSQNSKMKLKKHPFDPGSHKLDDSARSHLEDVKTISLARLIKENRIEKIDFLKVDIEGAEKYILTNQNKDIFKHKVRIAIIETHHFTRLTENYVKEYFEKLGFRTNLKKHRMSSFSIEAVNLGFQSPVT